MKDNGVVIVFKIMKWCVKMILVITGIIPLARCSSGYSKKDGKITFNGKEITDKNFVVLSDEFAKDSTTAYYKEFPFSYADVASFEAVDEHYAKDKNKVYFCDEYREGQNYYLTKKQTIKELKNAVPSSFISLKYGYGKDSIHIKKLCSISEEWASQQWIYVNGIDRVDNERGYLTDNTVPCCWECNDMKATSTAEEFITHSYKIVAFQESKKLK